MRAPNRMLVLAWCAAVSVSGCTRWESHVTPAPTAFSKPRAFEARIVRRDSTAQRLYDPRTVGDSVVGKAPNGERAAVALADIARAESRRADGGRTALLLGGVLVTIVGVYSLLMYMAFSGAST